MKKEALSVFLILIFAVLLFFIYPNFKNFEMPVPISKPQPNPNLKVRASIAYWDQDIAVKSFKENADKINQVTLFWYYLDEDGKIQKYQYAKEDLELINFAKQRDIKVNILISNLPEDDGWDSERVENVLEDPDLRKQHILDIQKKLSDLNVDGVTIDYEEVDSAQKSNFSTFIKELSTELKPSGKFVGVALHPKRDRATDNQYGFQDWKSLSASADELYIMAFGEHWDEGAPGPIASINWLSQISKFALSQKVDMSKVYLGIPLYGYDWNEDSDESAQGLNFSEVEQLTKKYGVAPNWDNSAKAPYFKYEDDDGDSHEVWFENSQSFQEKINFAKDRGFGGVSLWRLGGEDPEIWNISAK